jgi:hypothetical protein
MVDANGEVEGVGTDEPNGAVGVVEEKGDAMLVEGGVDEMTLPNEGGTASLDALPKNDEDAVETEDSDPNEIDGGFDFPKIGAEADSCPLPKTGGDDVEPNDIAEEGGGLGEATGEGDVEEIEDSKVAASFANFVASFGAGVESAFVTLRSGVEIEVVVPLPNRKVGVDELELDGKLMEGVEGDTLGVIPVEILVDSKEDDDSRPKVGTFDGDTEGMPVMDLLSPKVSNDTDDWDEDEMVGIGGEGSSGRDETGVEACG